MLTNERYTGIYIYQDIRIPGGIPAIITQAEFDAVQRASISKKIPAARLCLTPPCLAAVRTGSTC